MYYVEESDSSEYISYDPMPHNSPNPYESLLESFKTAYTPFASGTLPSTLFVTFILIYHSCYETFPYHLLRSN